MKKRLQGFIVGAISGIVLTSGIAIASNTTTLYDVMTSGIKIFVDGQKINPKDVNGNKVEPFIYNGTTYLPVRAVADALGKAVYWDGPNYTVYLGQAPYDLEYPTVQLENMTSIANKPTISDQLTDNYGNNYNRAIWNFGGVQYEYLLNMKYAKFKGVLYIPQGETSNESVILSIIADGKTIYTSPAMTKTSSPVNIAIDVRGYNDLKIEYNHNSNSEKGGSYPTVCLADAGFYQ